MFCRVRPALPDEVGFLSNRRISDDFSSRGTGSKKKVDSKLHIEFPDSSAEAKKITLKYSGDQVGWAGGGDPLKIVCVVTSVG